MVRTVAFLAMTFAMGCAAAPPRPSPQAALLRALPPHVEEVAYGLYACGRGYVLYGGRCLTDAEGPHGPVIIVSDLPSAGVGARDLPERWLLSTARERHAALLP